MGESFFELDGETYIGLDPARGPWSPDHCHAGPVAGAIARSVECAFGPDRSLTRLTVDLIRPVPVAGFTVDVEVTRKGKRLATGHAVLVGLDGKIAATATAMLISPAPEAGIPNAPNNPPRLEDAMDKGFPIEMAMHDKPYITHFMETLFPPGQDRTPGPTSMWMRVPPLLATEEPSSFQRICPLADCGNAISRNGEITDFKFLNTDLTIVAHRATEADWLHSEAVSHWHRNGVGLAEARISDEAGPVATALQSLIVAPH